MQNTVVDFVIWYLTMNFLYYFIKVSFSIINDILQSLSFSQSFQHREVELDWIIIWAIEWRHAVSKIKVSHDFLDSWSFMDTQVVHI